MAASGAAQALSKVIKKSEAQTLVIRV